MPDIIKNILSGQHVCSQYWLSGYWNIPGQVLKLHKEAKTWNDARRTCQQYGGDLVIVKDPLVNQWLADHWSGSRPADRIWIGASDQVGHFGMEPALLVMYAQHFRTKNLVRYF